MLRLASRPLLEQLLQPLIRLQGTPEQVSNTSYFLSLRKDTNLFARRKRQTTNPFLDERRGAAIHTEQIIRIRYRFIRYLMQYIPHLETYID